MADNSTPAGIPLVDDLIDAAEDSAGWVEETISDISSSLIGSDADEAEPEADEK